MLESHNKVKPCTPKFSSKLKSLLSRHRMSMLRIRLMSRSLLRLRHQWSAEPSSRRFQAGLPQTTAFKEFGKLTLRGSARLKDHPERNFRLSELTFNKFNTQLRISNRVGLSNIRVGHWQQSESRPSSNFRGAIE